MEAFQVLALAVVLAPCGDPLVPRSCDYAFWNEHAPGRAEAFTRLRQSGSEIKRLALWMDGRISKRAVQEFKNRIIDFAPGVLPEASKPSTP